MTVIRHVTPVDIPAPITTDITTDFCTCGATYSTRNGDPDPSIYCSWMDVHVPHMEDK